MNKKEFLEGFEQLELHSTKIANLVAEYYKQLKDKKVPENLAQKLTQEFHVMIWTLGGGK